MGLIRTENPTFESVQVIYRQWNEIVRRLQTKDLCEEIELSIERPLDVLRLAKPVLLALEQDICHWKTLLAKSLDHQFCLVGWHDFVFVTLKERDGTRQLIK